MRTLLRGGIVVDPIEGERRADLVVDGSRIAEIDDELSTAADRVLDVDGLLIMPGGIDTHSHADSRVFDDEVQLALLRSGVTTVITGQDGVSFAPGDGEYATDYFGALNGTHPDYRGGGVRELLRSWRGRTRLNVGYLVPAGTVRHQVLGNAERWPTADELAAMIGLVREGLEAGALGLSTGLDYVPGRFADAAELAALCRPLAELGGVYVSHIRGYEEKSAVGVAELIEICRTAGVPGHVSHFHARPELIKELLDQARAAGVELSWDAYPYFRGFTLLSMVLLPPEVVRLGNAAAAELLDDPIQRRRLREEFDRRYADDPNLGTGWQNRVQVADAGHPRNADLDGLTLAEAGRRRGLDPLELGHRLLAESALNTTTVMEIPQPRTDGDLARQFALPGACSGSDGIFAGGAPHPRAYGSLSRMYSVFGRVRRDFSWPELASIAAGTAAERFSLVGRGRVIEGAIADLVVLDPDRIRDRADYQRPTELSDGIDQVLVGGQLVLQDGRLTGELAGGPIRRT